MGLPDPSDTPAVLNYSAAAMMALLEKAAEACAAGRADEVQKIAAAIEMIKAKRST